jgi:hypothetical protein
MSRKIKKPIDDGEYSNTDEINKKIKKKSFKISKSFEQSPPRKTATMKKSSGPKIRKPISPTK